MSNMKVLLIGNYVPDGQTSMLAFKRILERELPRNGCELRVLTPPRRVLRVPTSSRLWKWLGYVDKFILFIPTLSRHLRWADVVHVADHSNGMYIPWVKSKPNVITCHDVIAVQAAKGMVDGWNVGWTGRLFQRLIAKGLRTADLVACVSHLTRRELLALGLAEEARVTVVLNGLNDDFRPVPPEEAQGLIRRFGISAGDKFLVHVGWDLARKNRRKVLETFIALRERAAASGRPAPVEQLLFIGPELVPEMAELACKHGVADQVKTVQGVSHEELRALYASATALLFPSLQEGFGWPVIEAQACGCPVFTSDLAPMNEIGGEGAVYVDPDDADAMAAAIENAAPRFAEMRRLGIENAAHYSAQRMASNYVATYRRVLDERKAAR
ncbi:MULTISPECIES: glycosyltransferase family 1 protein [unclassified Variovorax]|uniref:glycosyltransferase family 4 protein n=1 Tax=unclassified Variovorax TaxID=663243 RepID=UPI00076CCB7C|nr:MULTISPECIES: glycosyltransferase family 1 protein [unclassified Variovorax]KWT97070.1 mannosyltransferase [Variovorax sp. WDL1]PNG47070.1 D-inositol 3-phosphate glycosyltransferase [Variovorax sp. B2]PNG48279.1 D-inositol 3-phosphate glycosyltransferase [Variovorax sp. B4]VTV14930.1 D-inositol 3-phosphate glycosyltransferase [Variovorax sp. WDL1]